MNGTLRGEEDLVGEDCQPIYGGKTVGRIYRAADVEPAGEKCKLNRYGSNESCKPGILLGNKLQKQNWQNQ
jgi:hypothetical protein